MPSDLSVTQTEHQKAVTVCSTYSIIIASAVVQFLSFLRARIHHKKSFESIFFSMNRTESDSIWWKHTNLPPSGNHVLHLVMFFPAGTMQISLSSKS